MEKADIGVIGLGVMGQMLALNMDRNGFRVAGYDLDAARWPIEPAIRAAHRRLPRSGDVCCAPGEAAADLDDGAAGEPVDAVIDSVKERLDPDDLLIDGGNSHFTETERRTGELEPLGIRFLGTGVSGGSMVHSGGLRHARRTTREAWERMKPIFEAIAAKVDGEPCVAYMGPRGAGHYVKMVHNGIEYGDMQLIAEVYDVLHRGLGLPAEKLHEVLRDEALESSRLTSSRLRPTSSPKLMTKRGCRWST